MAKDPNHQTIIGRASEKQKLQSALDSNSTELIAIYGRRRVGKTFLIRQFLRPNITFELTGLHHEPKNRQLENFTNALKEFSDRPIAFRPTSWLEAFESLKDHVQAQAQRRHSKQVLFFDELPWLATPRSGFLAAFEAFWNTFISRRNDVVLVICGSAASWMIRKVIGSKGGLHNRITGRIRLDPFTLHETKQYLQHNKIGLDDFQIAQLYMAIGGIPHYLSLAKRGQSTAQIIDQLCFQKDGLLTDEFQHLYAALFDNHEMHEAIVRALGKAGKSLTRNELLKQAELPSGGSVTRTLDELIQSGFVHENPPRDHQVKQTVYRLADEYSLFYLNWIESNRTSGNDVWLRKAASRRYAVWSGYAFESLCLKHLPQIKQALGISAVATTESSWRFQSRSPSEAGAQIDLVIDRDDHCTNLCEMKFSQHPFVIDKRYASELARKEQVFREQTQTRNVIFLTMVTSFGVKSNDYAQQYVAAQVTLKDLFQQHPSP